MSKVILQVFIDVPDKDLSTVKRELENHINLTLEEPGCLVFKVTEDEANPNRFNVYEEFVDKSAFELHQKRVHSSNWGNVTKDVERHYEISA